MHKLRCRVAQYQIGVMDRSSYEVTYDRDMLQETRTKVRATMIGWGTYGPGMVDGTGHRLTPDEYARSERYNWFERRNAAGASLLDMVRIVEGTMARLHLPKTVGARAVEIYRKAHAVGIRRPLGRIGAAAVYIACRESRIPVSITEIVSPCDRRLVWKMHNRIIFALNLRTPLRDASREVPRIVAAANLPPRIERGAIVLLRKLSEMNREKKGLGIVLAAATIYLCSRQAGIEISKRQIALAARVNECTVGEYCKRIAATSSLAERRLPPRQLKSGFDSTKARQAPFFCFMPIRVLTTVS